MRIEKKIVHKSTCSHLKKIKEIHTTCILKRFHFMYRKRH